MSEERTNFLEPSGSIFWAQIRWGSWQWDSRDGLQRLRPHRSRDGKLNWTQWDKVFKPNDKEVDASR